MQNVQKKNHIGETERGGGGIRENTGTKNPTTKGKKVTYKAKFI